MRQSKDNKENSKVANPSRKVSKTKDSVRNKTPLNEYENQEIINLQVLNQDDFQNSINTSN